MSRSKDNNAEKMLVLRLVQRLVLVLTILPMQIKMLITSLRQFDSSAYPIIKQTHVEAAAPDSVTSQQKGSAVS